MKIITLTTDMGNNDGGAAVLKGTALTLDPSVQLIDISHTIRPFDFQQAAFILRSTYSAFPKGTIHLMGVLAEPTVNGPQPELPSIMEYDGHFFVGNNNGFFSLICGTETPTGFYTIDDVLSNPKAMVFSLKNLYLPICVRLANGEKVENLASKDHEMKRVFQKLPTLSSNVIIGEIVHIDYFGNLISNIDKETFFRFGNHPFKISLSYNLEFDEISTTYNDVPPGEKVVFFNENEVLEFAINRGASQTTGGADSLMNISLGHKIRVEIYPPGSKDSLF